MLHAGQRTGLCCAGLRMGWSAWEDVDELQEAFVCRLLVTLLCTLYDVLCLPVYHPGECKKCCAEDAEYS